MQATTREVFQSLRRTYRVTKKLSAAAGTVQDGQQVVCAKLAAVSALRKFTGQWDTFDVEYPRYLWSTGSKVWTTNGRALWRGHVTNTAVAFFRRSH